jgi:hypothetical protein
MASIEAYLGRLARQIDREAVAKVTFFERPEDKWRPGSFYRVELRDPIEMNPLEMRQRIEIAGIYLELAVDFYGHYPRAFQSVRLKAASLDERQIGDNTALQLDPGRERGVPENRSSWKRATIED